MKQSLTNVLLALGLFHPFLDDKEVEIFGIEAAGKGLKTNKHAASLSAGTPGILHGNRTYLLQDNDGQINDAHSISAGLDYPGIGPEHSWLHDIGRIKYLSTTDEERLAAFKLCSGHAVLSREKAKREESWINLEKALEEQKRVNGVIFGKVKGGFITTVDGLPCFMPSSQIEHLVTIDINLVQVLMQQ